MCARKVATTTRVRVRVRVRVSLDFGLQVSTYTMKTFEYPGFCFILHLLMATIRINWAING